jgi:hypothetical protein
MPGFPWLAKAGGRLRPGLHQAKMRTLAPWAPLYRRADRGRTGQARQQDQLDALIAYLRVWYRRQGAEVSMDAV